MNRAAVTVGAVIAGFVAVGVLNLARTAAPAAAEAARDAQARLDSIPAVVAGWRGTPVAMDPNQMRVAEAQAHLSRSYAHPKTGQQVHALILFGEPGPLGAHTPDVCYGAAGYHPLGRSAKRAFAGASAADGPDELWSARFESGTLPRTVLQVTWGWAAGGGRWEAADSPRVRFAAHGRIHKLYLSRGASADAPPDAPDPSDEFVGPFLSAVRAALVGPPPAAPETPPASPRPGDPPAGATGDSPGGPRP